MTVLNWITAILGRITFREYRRKREARKRRQRYEAIKALVVQRHLAGFGGVVLSKKYDSKDLQSFMPPMYQVARTNKDEPVIFWRKELMTEEVGPPLAKASGEQEH